MLLLVGLVGCGGARRVVRLDTGDGAPFVHSPREAQGFEPAEAAVGEDAFKQAMVNLARDVRPFAHPLRDAQRLFEVPARSGLFLYEGRSRRVIPLETGDEAARGLRLLESRADEALTRAYGHWCERKGQPSDCLSLLDEGPLLGGDGKYALTMAIAMDSVWEETAEALKGMTDPQALLATVTSAVTAYMLLWTLPEPVSKGLAALVTATAIAYLGVDTVWRILDGWVDLVRQVDGATTFEALRTAGERYGKVLGTNAVRVFVMVATAAIGNTAGLAAKASGLPGSAQAALAVESQAGYRYVAMEGVRSVAMTSEGFTLALAPNALAMASQGPGSDTRKHHIGTIANEKSTARGGPWTPKFRDLFKRAGMELKDPENVVPVRGHVGPHPQEYHELVYERLRDAMKGCRSVNVCRQALIGALKELAEEITTVGTELNRLVTRSP